LEIEAPHPSNLSLTRIYRSRNIGLNYIHTEDIHVKRMLTKAGKFAKTPTAILIRGKSRTEKSILAQAIHNHSARKNLPCIVIGPRDVPED